jgi:hypothetical protein
VPRPGRGEVAQSFDCWNCGSLAGDEPMPLGRETRCRACGKNLHVCRQCTFYDTTKGKSCAEPIADEVRDKERANFCGYFTLNLSAYGGTAQADTARDQLAAMFALGDDTSSVNASADAEALLRKRDDEADAAQRALGELFGLDKDKP